MMDASLQSTAQTALALMRAQGFEHAQVSASFSQQDELNIADNQVSLMRSTASQKMSLLGLVDGRKASTELSEFEPEALRERIKSLFADAKGAPQDAANAVSTNQRARITQGPQQADLGLLADKADELLKFRAAHTPLMGLQESSIAHSLVQSHTLTTGGSDLQSSVGWYGISAFGTAKEGKQSSSFNEAHGAANELSGLAAQDYFGLADMMRDTSRQIHTQALTGKFQGDVVLMPSAVQDLLNWLLGQLSDMQLIAGSSLYRDKVGQVIASPLFHLQSRFEGPGCAAQSADAFVAQPVALLQAGRLQTLIPSLYASRKTGLAHVPTGTSGWTMAAGETPRADMVAGVQRGALVGRLSMGSPAPNGDFSSVIKNSFLIEGGAVGPALSEVMISGNMARMLHDALSVSRESIDTGSVVLPWLRIGGLHFS
jgi:PmbA protein